MIDGRGKHFTETKERNKKIILAWLNDEHNKNKMIKDLVKHTGLSRNCVYMLLKELKREGKYE